MIYIVVSDGNELLALRHANLENDTLRMTRKRQKSIPRMDNEAKSTARAERMEIKYESLILAQDKRWRRKCLHGSNSSGGRVSNA